MTFKKFEELFLEKYPEGTVWMHDEFCHGEQGKRQKVGVVFKQRGKVYMYAGAYEDILSKVGIEVISKQRFSELLARLDQYKRWQADHGGTDGFFGLPVDYSKDIAELEARIEEIKKDCIIA